MTKKKRQPTKRVQRGKNGIQAALDAAYRKMLADANRAQSKKSK